jgi:hypothetical protein
MDVSNPACENYNPCWDKVAVSADFEMSEIYNFVLPKPLKQFNPDVAFRRSKIGFRPPILFGQIPPIILLLGT